MIQPWELMQVQIQSDLFLSEDDFEIKSKFCSLLLDSNQNNL